MYENCRYTPTVHSGKNSARTSACPENAALARNATDYGSETRRANIGLIGPSTRRSPLGCKYAKRKQKQKLPGGTGCTSMPCDTMGSLHDHIASLPIFGRLFGRLAR